MDISFNCTECRKCELNCSIFLSLGKYSAMEKLKVIDLLRQEKPITEDQIQTIFMCNKCEACQESCSEEIPLIDLYDWARHKIFKDYGIRNEKQARLITNILNSGNPFGLGHSRLEGIPGDLIEDRIIPSNKPVPESTSLLHLGCMLSFRLHDMREDVLAILNLLKLDFSILEEENCCGYFIYNTGDHESSQKIIERNTLQFKGANKIICACAGCYIYFKEHYPDSNKFYHIIEIIEQEFNKLIESNEISPIVHREEQENVLFHDSCHLTRPFGITEAPRNILKILGLKINEFSHSKKEGLCCGADGGMRLVNPELALKIGRERLNEAESLNSSELLTLCPFCIFNFQEAKPKESELKIGSLYKKIRTFLENK